MGCNIDKGGTYYRMRRRNSIRQHPKQSKCISLPLSCHQVPLDIRECIPVELVGLPNGDRDPLRAPQYWGSLLLDSFCKSHLFLKINSSYWKIDSFLNEGIMRWEITVKALIYNILFIWSRKWTESNAGDRKENEAETVKNCYIEMVCSLESLSTAYPENCSGKSSGSARTLLLREQSSTTPSGGGSHPAVNEEIFLKIYKIQIKFTFQGAKVTDFEEEIIRTKWNFIVSGCLEPILSTHFQKEESLWGFAWRTYRFLGKFVEKLLKVSLQLLMLFILFLWEVRLNFRSFSFFLIFHILQLSFWEVTPSPSLILLGGNENFPKSSS